MKKLPKIILIASLSLIGLCVLTIGMVWLSKDTIKQYAITQLNQQLNTPITVGNIDITFIEQFPRVSLLFNDVLIEDPLRPKQFLLKAKRVFIAFNINDILTKNYNIKLIEADSGQCNLFVNAANKPNYIIVKTTSNTEKDAFINLKSIELKNIKVTYEDLSSNQFYHIDALDVKISGDIKGKQENLNVSGNMYVHSIKSNTVKILKNREVELDIALTIDEQKSLYTFEKALINIGHLSLAFNGSITNKPKGALLDINFAAQKIELTELFELLPFSISQRVKEYKSKGTIYLNGIIKGMASSLVQPEIKVQFGITNGVLTATNQKVEISAIQCKGEFSNGINRTSKSSYLLLPTLSFNLGEGQFNGSLTIQNFDNIEIDLALKGKTSIQDVIDFTESQWIEKANGQLEFDIAMKGNLNELTTKNGFANSQTHGVIVCNASDIIFKNGAKKIERLDTKFSLKQKDLTIDFLNANIGKSDITVSGTLMNIVPYLLTEQQVLNANITYKSDYINLQHLLLPIPETANSTNTFALPQNLNINAQVIVAKLEYHDFKASKIKGNINWQGKKIETQDLECETMNGQLQLKGKVENSTDGKFLISSHINCIKVDMFQLFSQCNNFGQTAITAQNIRGSLTSNFDLIGEWTAKMDCDLDKLYAFGNIHITNGQLLNYQPMEALSAYINVEELRNLKFADLTNTIEIKNKIITIPSMDVKNNALNISIAGTHNFDNIVDYHIKLKLNDFLAQKYKKRNSDIEEENLENGTNLFISMKGPIDNLKFSYDKKQLRQQVKETLKKEKTEVRKIWRKELGVDNNETIKEKQSTTDELEFEKE